MSYDEKTDKMDWKDEYTWMVLSLISGVLLSFLFFYFDKLPNSSPVAVISICCISFYILSILVRIQNHRGKVLTGKRVLNEEILKFVFPVLGFGIALLIFFY